MTNNKKGNKRNNSLENWQKSYFKERGREFKDDSFSRLGNIELKPLYTTSDQIDTSTYDYPSESPFVRGPYASMYKNKPWTIRQYSGFSTAEETNKFFRKNISKGQKGLSVAFDLATHRGYDSDHERARDDVGKAGVAIDSVEDMKVLFKDIDLSKMSVSMTMNGAVLPIMACFIVAANEASFSKEKLMGTIQNDILKEFMVRNTYIYPPKPSLRITSDIIAYTSKYMPKFNSISISGYHIHEAGSSCPQEIAFTIADGLEYVRAAIDIGLAVDEFANRLSFFFAIGMDFFTEIAKLRAARYLWAKNMEKLFSPKEKKSKLLRAHCQTSGVSLTDKDPYNNIVRTALEALAAVLGGTQSLHTNAFDEAIALPTEFSAKIARATQQILNKEAGICEVIDPLGGSYYLENLTWQLINESQAIIDKVESMGGMTKAIIAGYPKGEIEKIAAIRQAKIDNGQTPIVGVNYYPSSDEDNSNLDVRIIDNEEVLKKQLKKLKKLKQSRCQDKVDEALAVLTKLAANSKSKDLLLEAAVNAARSRATVGEISQALEKVFSRYEANSEFVYGYYSNVYAKDENSKKDLKIVSSEILSYKKEFKATPKIYVAKLGQDGHDRGARVISSAFKDFGFDVILGQLFQNPKEVAKAASKARVDVIGLSSLAGAHLSLVKKLKTELEELDYKVPIVVGGIVPKEEVITLKQMGVLQVFGPGTAIIKAGLDIIALIRNYKLRNV